MRQSEEAGKAMKLVEKTQTLKMFVGGQWVDSTSGETFDASSPATGEVIATIPKGNREDASRAIEAAHRARQAMADLGAFDRAALLHRVAEVMERRRDDLAHWLTRIFRRGRSTWSPAPARWLAMRSPAIDWLPGSASSARPKPGARSPVAPPVSM